MPRGTLAFFARTSVAETDSRIPAVNVRTINRLSCFGISFPLSKELSRGEQERESLGANDNALGVNRGNGFRPYFILSRWLSQPLNRTALPWCWCIIARPAHSNGLFGN